MIYDVTLEIAGKGGGFESQEAALIYNKIRESIEATQVIFNLSDSFLTIWKDKNMKKFLDESPAYENYR